MSSTSQRTADFKDFPGEPIPFVYRGHIKLDGNDALTATSSATMASTARTVTRASSGC
jgi:hypothetical protein